MTLLSNNGKPIASVFRDNLGRLASFKEVNDKHILRRPPAIAYDFGAVKQATELGVHYHVVYDRVNGLTRSAFHSTLINYGIEINRGFGKQVALCLEYWSDGDEPNPTPILHISPPSEPLRDQESLFKEAC